jgi:hypothetical protein
MNERYQLEEHKVHGELEQYIKDNNEDLIHIMKKTEQMLHFLIERGGQHAA